jgi:hypothetical protein
VQLEPGMLGEQGQHVLLFASQRCPVGSHATVTPAKPALLACPVQRQRQRQRQRKIQPDSGTSAAPEPSNHGR